jgi:hypothetical protein
MKEKDFYFNESSLKRLKTIYLMMEFYIYLNENREGYIYSQNTEFIGIFKHFTFIKNQLKKVFIDEVKGARIIGLTIDKYESLNDSINSYIEINLNPFSDDKLKCSIWLASSSSMIKTWDDPMPEIPSKAYLEVQMNNQNGIEINIEYTDIPINNYDIEKIMDIYDKLLHDLMASAIRQEMGLPI